MMMKSRTLMASSALPFLFVAGSTVGHAATVFSTITPIVVSSGTPVSINLNASLGPVTDPVDDLNIAVFDLGISSISSAAGEDDDNLVALAGPSFVARFEPGETVDSSAVYGGEPTAQPFLAFDAPASTFPASSSGEWGGGQTGYIGLQFDISGEVHYGFARVTWMPDNDGSTMSSVSVVDQIGYNTVPGEGAVIPVPEPSITALLAVLGLGVFVRRRG